jgi:hypothetical protein
LTFKRTQCSNVRGAPLLSLRREVVEAGGLNAHGDGLMRKEWSRRAAFVVTLPALLLFAGFSFWRFAHSPAFRVLVERTLSEGLAARVSIASTEIAGLGRIAFSGLELAFLADGRPSGLAVYAARTAATAERVLGVGALREIMLDGMEVRLVGGTKVLAGLDILKRPASGRWPVDQVGVRDAAFSFSGPETGGAVWRVPGMYWEVKFGPPLAVLANIEEVRIEGARVPQLEKEAPRISFKVELDGSNVAVKDLQVSGRSGWRLAGESVSVSGIDRPVPFVSGKFTAWGINFFTAETVAEGLPQDVSAVPAKLLAYFAGSERARVWTEVNFRGPADDIRGTAVLNATGLAFREKGIGLVVEGIAGTDVTCPFRMDIMRFLRGMRGVAPGTSQEPSM